MEINKQYFSEEQVKSGYLTKFLTLLMDEAYGSGDCFNDIHIYPEDCGAFIIEWVQRPWSGNYGGYGFQYIGNDDVVMKEKFFPDNHSELCYDEDDYSQKLDEWLKDNPGWEKTSYGVWVNNNLDYLENLTKSERE